jgi:iodotyrosine deiodinase
VPTTIPLPAYCEYPESEMRRRAAEFRAEMEGRRSVRDFSDRAVPREVVLDCIRAAGSAPSGANRQPWHFVVVTEPGVKRRIREEAEREERAFYERRATDAMKPFLETAPVLVAVFAESHGVGPDGARVANYYVQESVGIATGLLIAAVRHAGLVSLTHTPSPMAFLNEILGRPSHERPFLLLVVGYPAEGARVPAIRRKPLEEIASFV